jgi:16S rRNA (cytosine967-C5)-methyltransferase
LALDRVKNIELTVSDIRSSVLANLNKRLAKAGWKNYTQLEVDLTKTTPHLPQQQLIICDAPCSGSGTWGRTPENIRFFTEEHIRHYTERQRAILAHILPLLQAGGYLLYITCSVFREENEEMVAWLLQEGGMELVKQEVIQGYRQQADTMFGALLRKV